MRFALHRDAIAELINTIVLRPLGLEQLGVCVAKVWVMEYCKVQ